MTTVSHPDQASNLVASTFPAGLGSFIGGHVIAGDGDTMPLVHAPSGATIAELNDAGGAQTEALIAAATAGAKVWAATDPFERARILRRVAAAIEAHIEELAVLEATTVGKPIRDTRVEAAKVAEMFGYYAGWADKVGGHTIPVPGNWLTYTNRVPLGVVVAITPWNAPLFTAGWNSAAPIAAGNAVIVKPSELTPLSTIRLAQIATEAGLPPGVFGVGVGLGETLGAALTTDRRIGKVSFIGSVPTGRRVAVAAAEAGIPTVMELGGKSANIVFADADLDAAAEGALSAIFAGAGQSCVAGSRLLVERSVHDALVEKIVALTAKLRVGDPLDPTTEVGPIIAARQHARIAEFISHGEREGAVKMTSSALPPAITAGPLANGTWTMPTILDGVKSDHSLETTEVFGPVLGIDSFDTEDEAIERANATPFGLAGAVWTANVARAHRVASQVHAGTFWINAYKTIHVAVPFGGFHDSGHGRSSGAGVLDEYTQLKAVWVPTAPVQRVGGYA